MYLAKNGIGSQNFGTAKKPVWHWLCYRSMGTHAFVSTLPFFYLQIAMPKNHFLCTYGAVFENFSEKFGTSKFLFLALAPPNIAESYFFRKVTHTHMWTLYFFILETFYSGKPIMEKTSSGPIFWGSNYARKCQKINFWIFFANFEWYPHVTLVLRSVLPQNSDPPIWIMSALQSFSWNVSIFPSKTLSWSGW